MCDDVIWKVLIDSTNINLLNISFLDIKILCFNERYIIMNSEDWRYYIITNFILWNHVFSRRRTKVKIYTGFHRANRKFTHHFQANLLIEPRSHGFHVAELDMMLRYLDGRLWGCVCETTLLINLSACTMYNFTYTIWISWLVSECESNGYFKFLLWRAREHIPMYVFSHSFDTLCFIDMWYYNVYKS